MDEYEAKALLEWYAEAGVDEAIGAEPVDRFSVASFTAVKNAPVPSPRASGIDVNADATSQDRKDDPTRQKTEQTLPVSQPNTAKGSDDPIADARSQAAKAQNLEELEEFVRDFGGCSLKTTAKHTCFASGSPDGGIMFIGEAPGRDEDLSGTPFVGRAGQLLDKMMAAVALDRSNAYITNILYWRPPGNRNPTPAEAAICRPFIERQIALVQPDVLVFLGGQAAKQMFDTNEGIMRLRGKWRDYTAPGGQTIKAIATLHPAYLLRQPGQKKLAWQDFRQIRSAMDKAGHKSPEAERA